MMDPVPPDTEHTTTKLARALREIPKPGVPLEMIRGAEVGYYHDFLSPLAWPEVTLARVLLGLAEDPARQGTPSRDALLALRQRVIDGEFDASAAESGAWGESDEGRAAMGAFREQVARRGRTGRQRTW